MQKFEGQQPATEDDELLRTAVELYHQDRERNLSRKSVEQVLTELEIPLDYLTKAKAEIAARQQEALAEEAPKPHTRSRRVIVFGAVAAALALMMIVLFSMRISQPADAATTVTSAQVAVSPMPADGFGTQPAATGGSQPERTTAGGDPPQGNGPSLPPPPSAGVGSGG